MKRLPAIAAALAVAAALTPGSAVTAAYAAAGIGHFSGPQVLAEGCSVPIAITFAVNTPDFVMTQAFGPGANGLDLRCLAAPPLWENQFSNLAPTVESGCPFLSSPIRPDRLSVSGSTYTITNTYRHCDGSTQSQLTTLRILPTTIVYLHQASTTDDGVTTIDVEITGNLVRTPT